MSDSRSRDRECFRSSELLTDFTANDRTDIDRPGAVGDLGTVEHDVASIIDTNTTQADMGIECDDLGPHHQATILAIGISRRSEAPASFNAGISVLIERFSTTDSTA